MLNSEPIPNFELNAEAYYSNVFCRMGILDFKSACNYIAKLPYGRNADRNKPELVISEKKGTCSSKHTVLKLLAEENHFKGLDLIMGIYKMSPQNTKGLHDVFQMYIMPYIPEAHCYLMFNHQRFDFTFEESEISRIQTFLLHEQNLHPSQTGDEKIKIHQAFIKNHIEGNREFEYSLDQIWEIRELCIQALGNRTPKPSK